MKEFKVLMVDDNDIDGMMMNVAFSHIKDGARLKVIEDGELGQKFLQDHYKDIDLVILDINLPGKNGIEILREFRRTEVGQRTPVVIFSTSNLPEEVSDAYQIGANAYIVKPEQHSDFEMLAKGMHSFWSNENLQKFVK